MVTGGEAEELMEDDAIAGEAAEEDEAAGEVEDKGEFVCMVAADSACSNLALFIVVCSQICSIGVNCQGLASTVSRVRPCDACIACVLTVLLQHCDFRC